MEYYLSIWLGDGSVTNHFRVIGFSTTTGVLDLRPDASKADGLAIVAGTVLPDDPNVHSLGTDLDAVSPQLKADVEAALNLTLVSNTLRSIIMELFNTYAGQPNRWGRIVTNASGANGQVWLGNELIGTVGA